MKIIPVLWLLFFLSTALARDLQPPKGWLIEKQSGHFLLRPETLSSSQSVQARVYDAEPLPEDMGAWLKQQISKKGGTFQDVTGCRPRVRKGKDANCTTKTGGADQYWYAIQTSDQQIRFMHVMMSPSTLANMKFISSVSHLIKETAVNAGTAGTETQVVAKSAAPPSSEPGFFPQIPADQSPGHIAEKTEPHTPAKVTNTSSSVSIPLEGIYLHLEYEAGVGGAMYPVYRPYLFLTDGTVTTDLSYYPLSTNDVEAWRQRRPQSWGRWVKSANQITINWNGRDRKGQPRKPSVWDKWFIARSGSSGTQLSGSYQSIGGGGNTAIGGTSMVAAWNNYNFSPDGSMTNDRGSMGSDVGVVSSAKRGNSGTYRLDGHSIHLRVAGGKEETRWFFLFPDSNDVIGIGGTVFNKSKPRKPGTSRSRRSR